MPRSSTRAPPVPDFTGDGAYRRELDAGGRVHIDRPLPFLVLNRHADVAFSLAQRLATISPSNLVWPARDDADREAMARVSAVLAHQRREFPRFLLVSLHDLPRDPSLEEASPRLEPFRFLLGATADAPAQAAAHALQAALETICIDLREAGVESVDHAFAEPGLEPLADDVEGVSHLSLGLPQVYRVPGSEGVYPQILHELETKVFDALLQAFAAYVGESSGKKPPQHRALGRSSYIEAAVTVDRELARISRSFDFLLGVSPINTLQAQAQFESRHGEAEPDFRYRPLTVSPELAKRALYAIDLRSVEDPVLETLFREKQRELDQQLTMLQCRNCPEFRYASLMQYGAVEASLLDEARQLLAHVADPGADGGGDEACIDCHAVQAAADALIARYRHKVDVFKADTCLREDIAPGLMVSGQSVLISTATRMRRARLDALLQHEVSVHVLTAVNGNQQGLGIFGAGLAGYEGIQEGLGVFAEYVVGGLTPARLRLLAARVLVVEAMLDDASFVDCHRLLHHDHGFSHRTAFNIVARVFRSGGLAKDAIYLRGLKAVFAFVAANNDLDPFWFGKIAERHVPVVHELQARGILRRPAAMPEFLTRADARERIRHIRAGGAFVDLLRGAVPC